MLYCVLGLNVLQKIIKQTDTAWRCQVNAYRGLHIPSKQNLQTGEVETVDVK